MVGASGGAGRVRAWQASVAASDYWLAYATSSSSSGENAVRPPLLVEVYAAISAALVALMAARSFLVACVGLQTADRFFQQIHDSVVHTPMSFFDTTPSGRVLSSLSLAVSLFAARTLPLCPLQFLAESHCCCLLPTKSGSISSPVIACGAACPSPIRSTVLLMATSVLLAAVYAFSEPILLLLGQSSPEIDRRRRRRSAPRSSKKDGIVVWAFAAV
ncbi:hypothetical protein EJB05_15192, partial [Eragrostis curvula]